MIRFTKLRAAALVAPALVAMCFAACEQTAPTTVSEPAAAVATVQPAGASSTTPSAPSGFVDHPRIIDTQHARIFNDQSAADMQAAPLVSKEWNEAQRKIQPQLADGGTAYPNFTITTTTKVVGAAAIFANSFTSPSSSDLMFFGTTGSGGISGGVVGSCTGCTTNNFFALTNIHNASTGPNLAWAATISGGTSASSALSATGGQIYVLSDSGTLYCFETASGANCSTSGDAGTTWVSPSITIAAGGAVTPWVDSAANNAVYVNDGLGNLYRFNASTGAQVWKYNFTSSGSSALPVEVGLVIYIGDGSGNLWRIVDPGTGSAPTTAASIALSGKNGNCTGSTAINGSVSIDTRASLVFLPWGGCGYSFPYYCASGCTNTTGSWGVTSSGWTGSVPDKPFYTWPTIDGTYVYWVIADKPTSYTNVSAVWKATYAYANPIQGTPLINASSTTPGASVGSAPLVYGGNLFVGDQSGYIEEFGCASSKASSTDFLAETNAQGGTVNTPIVLDDATGNIEFGFTTSSGGGVAQFPLWESSPATNFNWNCPSGYVACDNQQCGTGPTSTECVPTAECSTGAACSTVAAAGATLQVGVGASEGSVVTGTQSGGICATGSVILGVVGASYGSPPSSPDDPVSGNVFDFASSCYATDSLKDTEANCPPNTASNCTCPPESQGGVNCLPDGGVGTFIAENGTFGDPCVGTGKHFYAWFVCGSPVDGGTADGGLPVFCSRQNVTPTTGSDPCAANPDGGAAFCQGTCAGGWGDCNNNLQYDGCETYVNGTDPTHCGSCTNSCTVPSNGSATCSGGVCGIACNSGFTKCGSSCVNEQTDPNNCGACGATCVGSPATCTSGTCSEALAYADVVQNGNQAYTGSLGMEFVVAAGHYIEVYEMGVFDDKGNGISSATGLTVALYTSTGTLVSGTLTTVPQGTGTPLVGGDRMVTLGTPVFMGPGTYVVGAWGFSASDENTNVGIAGGATASTMDTGGGLISFSGGPFFNNAGITGFPSQNTDGAPVNRYGAGTFAFGGGAIGGLGASCSNAIQCSTGACIAGACGTKGGIGTSCTINAACESNNCSGGFCIAPACSPGACTVGSSCEANLDCSSNNCNTSTWTCQANADGGSCNLSSDCTSGLCISNVCGGIAYADVVQTGNQAYTGSLGMEFVVNGGRYIEVFQMGVFDDQGNGISSVSGLTVALYTSAGALVTGTMTTVPQGTGTPLVGGDRMVTLGTPVYLAPGTYVVGAWGFSSSDENTNFGLGGVTASTMDTGGGALTFSGGPFFNNLGVTGFPHQNTDGAPANRYGSGTFSYVPGTQLGTGATCSSSAQCTSGNCTGGTCH